MPFHHYKQTAARGRKSVKLRRKKLNSNGFAIEKTKTLRVSSSLQQQQLALEGAGGVRIFVCCFYFGHLRIRRRRGLVVVVGVLARGRSGAGRGHSALLHLPDHVRKHVRILRAHLHGQLAARLEEGVHVVHAGQLAQPGMGGENLGFYFSEVCLG